METQQSPDRNLAMELMRATEAAALAGGRWMGRGDKNAADGAAVEAMRVVLNSVSSLKCLLNVSRLRCEFEIAPRMNPRCDNVFSTGSTSS